MRYFRHAKKYADKKSSRRELRLPDGGQKGFLEDFTVLKMVYGRMVRSIKIENNEVKKEPEEVVDEWRRYCEEKFKKLGKHRMEILGVIKQQELPKRVRNFRHFKGEAVRWMKSGKEAGEDTIVLEMIMAGCSVLIEEITGLFSAAWQDGRISVAWQWNSIIPLYKKGD